MVINKSLRQTLWKAYFVTDLRKNQYVDKFTGHVGCRTQIHYTLAEFDRSETGDFQYWSQRHPLLYAGGFSHNKQQCLKQVVDEDRDLFYDDLVELLDRRFNIRATVTQV